MHCVWWRRLAEIVCGIAMLLGSVQGKCAFCLDESLVRGKQGRRIGKPLLGV